MGVAPEFQRDPAALSMLYVRSSAGKLIPLNTVARVTTGAGPLSVSHTGQLPSVTISFNLKPGRRARRCRRADSGDRRGNAAGHRVDALPGHGAGVPGFAARPRPDSADGHRRDLPRARHPLRELHAAAGDSVGPAGRRLRRAADAADLQERAEPVCVRRRHHARRSGQEERHHDGRLRGGRRARARQDAARGDSRGVPGPLPADHDDDDVRARRDAADRAWARARAPSHAVRSDWRSSAGCWCRSC